ncbi:MAG: ABC transporter ATP-binding protein [Firmicutes bacterium]|jgi:ABC-2 type transport system ATP-binding protein|nr:ABC transporter ATP-binding protein [Bacillota bacterium]
MAAIIEAENLRKRFGDVEAVAGISFSVQEGELFGFLGPNGAGKTTTIKMLTGLARPDGGTLAIGGIDCSRDPKAAQHLIGVVPDESNLYPELTGFENLCFCAALYGMERSQREARARKLLESFGLAEAGSRKFGSYSKGMKRKLAIAAGIIHDPPILFLDEPTTGIDVLSARQIRQLIADLHRSGTTIFLTTHYIEEAERLCERIAFIVAGRIVRTDTTANLLKPVQGKHMVEIAWANAFSGEKVPRAFPKLKVAALLPGSLRVESDEPINVGVLVRFLEEEGAHVLEARRIQPSLEDVFVDITGIKDEGMGKKEGRGE